MRGTKARRLRRERQAQAAKLPLGAHQRLAAIRDDELRAYALLNKTRHANREQLDARYDEERRKIRESAEADRQKVLSA